MAYLAEIDFIILVLEGLSLLDYGISPYTGDTVHEVESLIYKNIILLIQKTPPPYEDWKFCTDTEKVSFHVRDGQLDF